MNHRFRKRFLALLSIILVMSMVVPVELFVYGVDSSNIGSGGGLTGYEMGADPTKMYTYNSLSKISGLKMSVMKFAYTPKADGTAVSEYEEGTQNANHTYVGAACGNNDQANNLYGVLPIFFMNDLHATRDVNIFKEGYIDNSGKVIGYEIKNSIVPDMEVDSDLEYLMSIDEGLLTKGLLNLKAFDFNGNMVINDNALADSILYTGEIETLTNEQLQYNKDVFRLIAKLILVLYNGRINDTDTLMALEQLYTTGNAVYNGYEYMFLIEPLCVLLTPSSEFFVMTPNQVMQYYLKSTGKNIIDMKSSEEALYIAAIDSSLDPRSKYFDEAKVDENLRTGLGHIFQYACGKILGNMDHNNIAGWSVMRRVWFTGPISIDGTRATVTDQKFGYGIIRPIDYTDPDHGTTKKAQVTTTVGVVNLNDLTADSAITTYRTNAVLATEIKRIKLSGMIDLSILVDDSIDLNTVEEYKEIANIIESMGLSINSDKVRNMLFVALTMGGEDVSIQSIIDSTLCKLPVASDYIPLEGTGSEPEYSANKLFEIRSIEEDKTEIIPSDKIVNLVNGGSGVANRALVDIIGGIITYDKTLSIDYSDKKLHDTAIEIFKEDFREDEVDIIRDKVGYGISEGNGKFTYRIYTQ